MCFISEAQQKALGAIAQRRAAQAALHGHHQSSSASAQQPALPVTPFAQGVKPEVPLAGLGGDPTLLHQYIQSIVQQQIAQQVAQQQQQQQPPMMQSYSIAQQLQSSSHVPDLPNLSYDMGCSYDQSHKRPADDMLMYTGEPMLKRQKYEDDDDSTSSDDKKSKKRRFVWTPELHTLFERAVASLDADSVGPKNIHSVMHRHNAEVVEKSGLNTQHIKSHLQKWRIARRRREEGGAFVHDSHCMPPTNMTPMAPSHHHNSPPPPQQKFYQQSPAFFQSDVGMSPSAFPMTVSPHTVVAPQVMTATPVTAPFSHHAFDTPPPQPPPIAVAPQPQKMVMAPTSLLAEPLVDDDALLAAGSWESLLDAPNPVANPCDAEGKEPFNPLDGMPTDVLEQLNQLAPGGGDGMSSAEIMRYMMLGYQLGYQNCFSEMAPSSGSAESSVPSAYAADDTFTMGIL